MKPEQKILYKLVLKDKKSIINNTYVGKGWNGWLLMSQKYYYNLYSIQQIIDIGQWKNIDCEGWL